MQKLVRLLAVIGLSVAGFLGTGCNGETALQLRDAFVDGAVTFIETATVEWLDNVFGQSTAP